MAIRTQRRAQEAEPQGASLYEVIKGIDFEKRELLGKRAAAACSIWCAAATAPALLRLHAVRAHLPHRLPEIDYCPEYPELPFDAAAARAAAMNALPPGDSCGSGSACVWASSPRRACCCPRST